MSCSRAPSRLNAFLPFLLLLFWVGALFVFHEPLVFLGYVSIAMIALLNACWIVREFLPPFLRYGGRRHLTRDIQDSEKSHIMRDLDEEANRRREAEKLEKN